MKGSLRARLLLPLLGGTLLLWGVGAAFSYWRATREVAAFHDAQLAQTARVLLSLSHHELGEELAFQSGAAPSPDSLLAHPRVLDLPMVHDYEAPVAFQVWVLGDRLVLRSPNAPAGARLAEVAGFSEREIGGARWRVYAVVHPAGEIEAQVAERLDLRGGLARQVAWGMLAPSIVLVPVLGLFIWWWVGVGLRPLRALQGQLARRAPDRLDALEPEGLPAEVRPLVEALNALLVRLRLALERERRFTADAAHELRTPLAALRTQAQVAMRAREGGDRQRALRRVVEGVDRMTHLVGQLLTLARMEPGQTAGGGRADLAQVVEEVTAQLAPLAIARGIDLSLEAVPAPVEAGEETLAVLTRNLVDNAVRYTPAGGRVAVRVAVAERGAAVLTVEDSGPGIPPEERQRVFERFYRRPGSAGAGCGLGLSIVRRIAELHGARIRLEESRYNGLRVEVRWPAPEPAPPARGVADHA
ncbi:sensor histidine kinase [Inmirania thermothiophila]|uniref:histidine kinase n=1 Tax=Inmirania thermothiophila TaxID=1750597 RepID=A0A3N1Y095_9GAMM|nr:sensor histidine kinase [Inmirania thermothiophila]ROR32240.1 two-component system sensor histidine kinase QseC [Inmirania thermothiophila]